MKTKLLFLRWLMLLMLSMGALGTWAQPYANQGAQTVCLTNVAEPYGVINTPGSTYSWSVIGGTASTDWVLTSSTSNLATVLWKTAGTYTIQVVETNSDNCVNPLPVTVVVTVNPTPVVTATPALQSICSGVTTGIALTSNLPNTTFTWSAALTSGTASGFSNGSGASIAQTLTNTTNAVATVTYTITPTALGCPGTPITVVITVYPTVTAIATPAAQSVCSGATTGIAITSNTGTATFTWTAALTSGTATGFSNGSGASIAQTLTNTTNAIATVTYTITPSDNSCPGTPITVVITVNPLPLPTITGPSPICVTTATSVYTTEAGMSNYIWTISAGGSITAGGNGNNTVTITWNSAGPQTVSVNYTNANGCTSPTPTVFNVTVNPLPVTSAIFHN